LNQAVENLLLDVLPATVREELLSKAELVSLPAGSKLFEREQAPRFAHVLTSGIASVVSTMENGDAVEVSIVGREGLPESLHLLGPANSLTHCVMQVSGAALRLSLKAMKETFEREAALRARVLEFVQYQSIVMTQVSACNRLHELEERLSRWLLMVQDRVGESTLRLTQEFLAEMLGTRRSTVTITAGSLQRMGAIDYSRGQIRVVDRAQLEKTACECYRVLRPMSERLYTDF
jgi:CRP-like cAMP-binding protein